VAAMGIKIAICDDEPEQAQYIRSIVGIRTKTREYKTKMNLFDIEKSLDNSFFRCQRSFIVNLKYVYKITRTFIVLDDMAEIPLSRNLYEAANQAVIKFFPEA
jgi:DNA-binding LytR/AlgR family response regulator